MSQSKRELCESGNRIRLILLHFHRAAVGETWNGTVINSAYSRLYYIVSGEALIKMDSGETLLLEAGNWYLLPAGSSFTYLCNSRMEHIYFHFKLCSFEGLDLLHQCKKPIQISAKEHELEQLETCLNSSGILGGLKVHQMAEKMVITFLEESGIIIEQREFSPCVTRAIRYINRHLSAKLSMEEILEHTYVSKSTLTKHFKKELSMSVHDYIFDRILFEAGQLLARSRQSVQEISEKFGFSDQFYFSKCFRKKYYMSPREYRKTHLI